MKQEAERRAGESATALHSAALISSTAARCSRMDHACLGLSFLDITLVASCCCERMTAENRLSQHWSESIFWCTDKERQIRSVTENFTQCLRREQIAKHARMMDLLLHDLDSHACMQRAPARPARPRPRRRLQRLPRRHHSRRRARRMRSWRPSAQVGRASVSSLSTLWRRSSKIGALPCEPQIPLSFLSCAGKEENDGLMPPS